MPLLTPTQQFDDRIADYQKRGVKRVKLGITDMDGVLRGKYISLDKLASIRTGTAGFCDCILGWDINDQLYDNATFTGWHTGFPDAQYRVLLDSERTLQEEQDMPFFLAEFAAPDDAPFHPICPRNLLKRIHQRADSMSCIPKMGFEYEFFVFNESPQSISEKPFHTLTPLSPGNCGYSVLRSTTFSNLFNEFQAYCDSLSIPLEGVHCETGPGVWEAALAPNTSLSSADNAVLFKTFAKAFFQKRDMIATFMAKWSMDYPGQSGHLHQSLQDKQTGENLFYDATQPHNMSNTMRYYMAGVLKYLKPLLALCAPTINSYTRLVKGAWAPTAATWGIDNRTTALRVIPGSSHSQRMEFRIGAADANPYLVAAATLGAGLLGVERQLPLEEAIQGNAYEYQNSLPANKQLATNLRDANRELAASAAARELFGDAFVDHFVASRDWEVREYERHVNDWQLKRYFELI